MSITGEHQWHSCQIRGKFRSVKLHLDLKMLQQALQAGLRVFMQHSLNLIPTHKTSNICREKQIEGGRVLISRLGGSVIVRWTNPSSVPSSAEPVLLSHNRRLFSFVRFQTVHLFFFTRMTGKEAWTWGNSHGLQQNGVSGKVPPIVWKRVMSLGAVRNQLQVRGATVGANVIQNPAVQHKPTRWVSEAD